VNVILTRRDKAIIEDLNRFRVMDRDSISELHFEGLRNPKDSTNHVLLRLLREGKIQRSTSFVPYLYFGPDVSMKKNSAKIGHFLAILNTYKEMGKLVKIETFLVEPKYGSKGMAEPDIFCTFRNDNNKIARLFIEVQKTIYSQKQMSNKLERYEQLFNSGVINTEHWQPKEKKVFPHVLILSEQRYAIDKQYPFQIIQSPSFTNFLQLLKPQTTNYRSNNGVIKINVRA
jgi:hypothetical protein